MSLDSTEYAVCIRSLFAGYQRCRRCIRNSQHYCYLNRTFFLHCSCHHAGHVCLAVLFRPLSLCIARARESCSGFAFIRFHLINGCVWLYSPISHLVQGDSSHKDERSPDRLLTCFSLRLDRKMNAAPNTILVRIRPSFLVLSIGLISLIASFTATTP